MVIDQNVVVWNQKYQKHRAAIFAMYSDFRYIVKISLYSENFASLAKIPNFAILAKLEIFAMP